MVSRAPKPRLKNLSEVSRGDAEGGRVSADVINDEPSNIRQTIGKRTKTASIIKSSIPPKFTTHEHLQAQLFRTLKERFEKNIMIHEKVEWARVEKALKANLEVLWPSLQWMESTGGKPDIIGEEKDEFVLGDCSEDSPFGRRNVVFDQDAVVKLKQLFPHATCSRNVADMVAQYRGIDLMSEAQYCALQEVLPVDQVTRSWLKTPADVRKDGVALIGSCYQDSAAGSSKWVERNNVYSHHHRVGFRVVLRVPKFNILI